MSLFRNWLLVFLAAGAAHGQQTDEAERANAARASMIGRVDALINAKIKASGFEPAVRAGDEEFVRRVYLDLTGAIPRVSEVRDFLADGRSDKRAILIDGLLNSPAHATHLANTWRNIMLPGGLSLEQIQNLVGVQNWLRQRFVENIRYDNLVSAMTTLFPSCLSRATAARRAPPCITRHWT
jgi:hypothetical protein